MILKPLCQFDVLSVVVTQLSLWLGFTPDQREFKLTKRKVIFNLGNLQCGHMNIGIDAAKWGIGAEMNIHKKTKFKKELYLKQLPWHLLYW